MRGMRLRVLHFYESCHDCGSNFFQELLIPPTSREGSDHGEAEDAPPLPLQGWEAPPGTSQEEPGCCHGDGRAQRAEGMQARTEQDGTADGH